MDFSNPERRAEPRVPAPPIPVYASSEDDVFFYGYIKNISPSGMLILSYLECEVGQEYTLEFSLPAKPELLSGACSVEKQVSISCLSSIRWCKEYAMAIYGPVRHGVKFIEAMPDATENIERWVKNQLRRLETQASPVNFPFSLTIPLFCLYPLSHAYERFEQINHLRPHRLHGLGFCICSREDRAERRPETPHFCWGQVLRKRACPAGRGGIHGQAEVLIAGPLGNRTIRDISDRSPECIIFHGSRIH